MGAGSDGILVLDRRRTAHAGDDPQPRRQRGGVLGQRHPDRGRLPDAPRRRRRADDGDAQGRDPRPPDRRRDRDRRRPGGPRRPRPPARRRRAAGASATRSSRWATRTALSRWTTPTCSTCAAVGEPIERHPWFPNRTNVEFYRPLEEHEIRMRVWERGAGETLSSGSGSTAAAVAAVVDGRRPCSGHGARSTAARCVIDVADDLAIRLTGPVEQIHDGRVPRRLHDAPGDALMRERPARRPAAAVPVRRARAQDRRAPRPRAST